MSYLKRKLSPTEKPTPKKSIKKTFDTELKEYLLSVDSDNEDDKELYKNVLQNMNKDERFTFIDELLKKPDSLYKTYNNVIHKIYKLLEIFINDDKNRWKKYINDNIDDFEILVMGMYLNRYNSISKEYDKIDINIVFPFIKILNYKSIYKILSKFIIDDYYTLEFYETQFTNINIALILQAIQNKNFLRKYEKDIESYIKYKESNNGEEPEILHINEQTQNYINEIISLLKKDRAVSYFIFISLLIFVFFNFFVHLKI